MNHIAIIGSGSWGVALAIHLAKLEKTVKLWSFSKEECDLINQERRCKHLKDITIPESIVASQNFKDVVEGSDLILHVTPSQVVRKTIQGYKEYVTNQPIIMCSKGFEKDTLFTLEEVIADEIPAAKIGALSGPSHAEEVSQGIPTAIVIASEDENLIKEVQKTFSTPDLRIYTSTDIKAVELGGALKNIIAFCAGVAVALELGDNSFAALITRGLAEMARLGTAMGGNLETFYGLTGLGDLIVTCLSKHSRNRRAGILIGQGKTLEEAREEIGMVVEGIDNIEVAYALSQKYNVYMPIVEVAYQVLFGGLDPKEAIRILMTRDLGKEN